jgi:histidinol-phosphatase (PHP family)
MEVFMYLADYHTHTRFSFDGCDDPDALCRRAVDLGLTELAITDHMDIFSAHAYDYILNCSELYRELTRCREKWAGRLRIVIGAELGQPMANPSAAEKFIADYPELDFIIGSVHQLENDLDVYYYNFRRRDPAAVYDHYLDWLTDLAANYDYDVIGHITYPLRYMAEAGFAISIEPFLEKIENLFRIVIRRDKGIELNVSGFRQSMQTTMPTPKLLKLYHSCGGRILTIGSDAHRSCDVGAYIRVGQEIAKECGFDALASYSGRVPTLRPIG